MAKLTFRYGTMASGKSLDLLKVAYNYEENGRNVLILTSAIDNRYGNNIVKSRTGLSKNAKEQNKMSEFNVITCYIMKRLDVWIGDYNA